MSQATKVQMQASAMGPAAGFRLLLAEWGGVRTEDVARESWAWSHSSRQSSSMILKLTAQIEEQGGSSTADRSLVAQRRQLMTSLIQHDYSAYVLAATTLGGLIDREDLPNVQDIPHPTRTLDAPQRVDRALLGGTADKDLELVPDCTLPNVTYTENALDRVLLSIFRSLVAKHTGYNSDKEGILGLLEQGREYMLRPAQTAEAQHEMVIATLAGLMTPVMPPIYNTFMSGRIGGKQYGPWFWAPALTSWVTPTFFGFLVGPSRPNRRRDGALGGLVVDKCKFLQESGCKGLCMNQCKLPAQQFFQENLGLPLTVIPNFETQECQWSFGEKPLPVEQDPSFPRGCLVGCPTREALREENQARKCG